MVCRVWLWGPSVRPMAVVFLASVSVPSRTGGAGTLYTTEGRKVLQPEQDATR